MSEDKMDKPTETPPTEEDSGLTVPVPLAENDEDDCPEAGDSTEAQAPAPFKPHPLLDRKRRRSQRFGNARQSAENPLLEIIARHERGQWRIGKICVAVFVVLILAVATHYYLDHLRVKRARQARLDEINDKLTEIERRVVSAAGYERDQALLDAINTSLHAAGIDFKNTETWQQRLLAYQEQLTASPVPGANFVVPGAVVDMVNIPRGRFNMGRRAKEPGRHEELPRHLVVLPYEFWLSRTEITNVQFRRFFRGHRTRIPGWEDFRFDHPRQPVAHLDWHAASEYCRLVTEYEEKAGRLPQGYEYRLPTEAEWEYACRAGTETYYFWGDEFGEAGAKYANILDEHARRRIRGDKREADMPAHDGFVVTAPVGHYLPNAFGLHDMIGNVWEWCWDWYNPAAYRELYSTAPVQVEPVAALVPRRGRWGATESVQTTSKIIRGGCWGSVPSEARSATRESAVPETKNSGIGFRLALSRKIADIDGGVMEDLLRSGD